VITMTSRRTFIKAAAASSVGFAVSGSVTGRIMGANDRLRIGLIGCGSRGTYLMEHALIYKQQHNVEIAALCDVWRPNLEKTRVKLAENQVEKPLTFSRYADVVTRPDIDAVIIATPDFAHTPILIDATREKKDAFVEKPMATRLDHANEAIRLVRELGTVVQVGTQRRSDQRHQDAAALLQSGILGQVSQVDTAWHDAAPRWLFDVSDVRAEDVDWEQYLMDLPAEPFTPERFRRWHLYHDFTTGPIGLLGSHLVDVATWFMDDPVPSSAVAHGGTYVWKEGREHADTIDCIMEYPKGFIVTYATRLGNNHPIPEAVFFGTKGTFDTASWTVRGAGGVRDQQVEGGTTIFAREQGDHMRGIHTQNWLECIRSRQTPNASVESGYAHSVMSIMVFDAWKSGRRQHYDPQTQQISSV
jgi:predicted dehydrogenase